MRKIIKGRINLSSLHFTELFDLSDVEEVSGDFSCIYNNLTSLKGAPEIINGSFNCSNNNLPSLEGSPHTVGRDFICYDNPLTSLDGIPTSIGGGFYISYIFKDEFLEEYINSLSKIKRGVFYH